MFSTITSSLPVTGHQGWITIDRLTTNDADSGQNWGTSFPSCPFISCDEQQALGGFHTHNKFLWIPIRLCLPSYKTPQPLHCTTAAVVRRELIWGWNVHKDILASVCRCVLVQHCQCLPHIHVPVINSNMNLEQTAAFVVQRHDVIINTLS